MSEENTNQENESKPTVEARQARRGEDLNPFVSGEINDDIDVIDLLTKSFDDLPQEEQDAIIKQINSSSQLDEWALSIASASRLLLTKGEFAERLREGDLVSSILLGDKELRNRRSRVNMKRDSAPKGEQARLYARNASALGTYVTTDLPDSGITVSMRPCQRRDLANLRDRYIANKYAMARGTGGMLNSMSMGATIQIFIDFVLEFVYFSSVGTNIDKLKRSILISDFDTMVGALAEATWKTGHEAHVPCTDRDCGHIETGRIDFAQMRRYDYGMLTDKQLNILTRNPSEQRSEELLEEYRKDFNFIDISSVVYSENNDFKSVVYFKTPSLKEYQKSVNSYYDSMGRDMAINLTQEATNKERAAWMSERMAIDSLLEYLPYIDHIEIIDKAEQSENIVIRGEIEIREIFRDLVDNDDAVKAISDAYLKYVSYSTASIICFPKYDCPACNKEMESHPKWKEAVPYNVYNVFFTMALLKLP